ncbi:MAG: DUF881 domain-containing protein [Armatimonadota bacterium]
MNLRLDPKRDGWIIQISVLSIVLGMLMAASLKTQWSIRNSSGIPTTRFSGLAQALLDEKDRNKLAREEIISLRAKVDKYEMAQGKGNSQSQIISNELQKVKFLAGLTPAYGKGIEITLRDSPKRPPSDADPNMVQFYVIHDSDLRDIVNELVANGAEAIAISDKASTQRVIGKTAIRCVGGVIKINDVPMGPPFVITAIGPSDLLSGAMEMRGGLLDNFRFIDGLAKSMVQIITKENLSVPAYSGNTSQMYAAPSQESQGGKQ